MPARIVRHLTLQGCDGAECQGNGLNRAGSRLFLRMVVYSYLFFLSIPLYKIPNGPPQSLSFFSSSSNITRSRLRSDPLHNLLSIQNKITLFNPLLIQDHDLDSHISTSPNPNHIIRCTTTILSSSPSTIPTLTSKMPSSSTTKTSKTYAPSVASTSSSASYTKPSKSTETSSKRSNSIISSAKRLLSDIGSPPTAAYDRQQAANGEKTDSQKAFYMPNQTPRRT